MRNRYLLGGIAACALIGSFAIFNKNSDNLDQGVYESRKDSKLNRAKQSAHDMLEYMRSLRVDPITGEIDEEAIRRSRIKAESMSRAGIIGWDEEGPSNIGGRTRAIHADINDDYRVYAGSVSGGLWVSGSRGDYWAKVETFSENLGVSSIGQTANGALIIGTGHFSENHFGIGGSGALGNGVYVYPDGNVNNPPIQIADTNNWSYINEILCDATSNEAWILTNSGVFVLNTATNTLVERTDAPLLGINARAGVMSKDGEVICIANTSRSAIVSTNGGATFENRGGQIVNGKLPAAGGRVEYAISHERYNGEYFLYASNATGQGTFEGAYVSSNSGQDWSEIAPSCDCDASPNDPFVFNPFRNQGRYDNIITVVPGSPEKAFLGGIDIYRWVADADNPTFGSWNRNTNWASSPTSPIYAHADQHEMAWDNLGRFYIGNDGGVGYSDDQGETWQPANRGYNVTQFYSVAYSAHGDVLGGTQDNGSLYNNHTNYSWQDFTEVLGGDGFDADISHSNRNMMFSTIYYCGVYRSYDGGVEMTPFFPGQLAASLTPGDPFNGPGNFNTVIRLYEEYDLNSTDSVVLVPNQAYSAGTTVAIPSNSSGDTISYVLPDTVRFSDTVNYDPNIYSIEYQVTDCSTNANRDLGIEQPWINLNSGQYPPLLNDTIIILNDPLNVSDDDTVIVCDTIAYRFYYATDPNTNDTLAMHIDSVLYNVPWDTIKTQDPFVSWLALGIGDGRWTGGSRDLGVWMSRYGKRFGENLTQDEEWLNVIPDLGNGQVQCMEFSRNGDFLYVGTFAGQLIRVTGYNDYYASTPGIVDSLQGWSPFPGSGTSVATNDIIWTAPGGGLSVLTGIGVDYSQSSPNGDHLIACIGGFSDAIYHAYEITDASTCAPFSANATPIHALGEIDYPVYDAIIDREDPNFVALATEYGVLVTQNVSAGTIVWENSSGDFGLTPVHALRQDYRTWDEGSKQPGKIYAGTHGRGIWSSSTFLNMPDDMNIGIEKEVFETNLTLYPNPMVNSGFLRFDLEDNSDVFVSVYSLSGKLVKNISQANLPKGDNSIQFNVSELPVGTYLVEFNANGIRETTKFIKWK